MNESSFSVLVKVGQLSLVGGAFDISVQDRFTETLIMKNFPIHLSLNIYLFLSFCERLELKNSNVKASNVLLLMKWNW